MPKEIQKNTYSNHYSSVSTSGLVINTSVYIEVTCILSRPLFTGLPIAKKNYPPTTENIQRITFWKSLTNRLKYCHFRSQILTARLTASRLLLTKLWLDSN